MISAMQSLLPVYIVISILLIVMFSQLAKKLDKKDRLKGYRVIFPLFFSLLLVVILCIGKFIEWQEIGFWWAALFGFAVFFYEAIIKHLENMKGQDNID